MVWKTVRMFYQFLLKWFFLKRKWVDRKASYRGNFFSLLQISGKKSISSAAVGIMVGVFEKETMDLEISRVYVPSKR